MFQDSPIFSVVSLMIAAYLFYMWCGDLRHFSKTGERRKGAFEGASPAPLSLCVAAAVAGAAFLLFNTWAEFGLGASGEQTSVAPWAILSWIGAAFVEELIFRGYLVVKGGGTAALWGSIFFFSLVFALGHPFIWNYEIPEGAGLFGGTWTFTLSAGAIFNTFAVFECSLLFYAIRFVPQNPTRSILPCIIAHAAYNCGVFAVKLAQGFVSI